MKNPGGLKVGNLVILTWHDIAEDPAWRETDDEHGVTVCESIGWVTKVARKTVTMTRSWGTDHGSTEKKPGDAITFPRGCIEKVEVLRAASQANATTKG